MSCNGIRSLYLFLPRFRRLSTSTNEGNPCSSTCSLANFLVNSLGFSSQESLTTSAKLAKHWRADGAKRVSDFEFVENANSVVEFFNQLGFQQSHIRKIVSLEPWVFVSRVDKTLMPKVKILNDIGISGSDLNQVIVSNPKILRQRLGPAIQAFRKVLGCDDNVVTMLKRSKDFYFCCAAKYLIPNVELLLHYCAISDDKIRKNVLRHPRIYTWRTDLFRDILIRVEQKLGIPRDSAMFLYGVHMLACFSEKNIEVKYDIFKSFGWSQSDVMKLIKLNPLCLTSSEAKIKERLDFLMNQLGYKPNYLASQPSLFTYSVEKRLLLRHRVLQVLKEKGLLRMNYNLVSAVGLAETAFLKRFILPFEEVHEVYAQLAGSTPGPLNVERAKTQKPILKVSSNSNAA